MFGLSEAFATALMSGAIHPQFSIMWGFQDLSEEYDLAPSRYDLPSISDLFFKLESRVFIVVPH